MTQRTAIEIEAEITQREARVNELTNRQSKATTELETARNEYAAAMAYDPKKAPAIHKTITALETECAGVAGALETLANDTATLRNELAPIKAAEAEAHMDKQAKKYIDKVAGAGDIIPELEKIVAPRIAEIDKALSDYRQAYTAWRTAEKANGSNGDNGAWRDVPRGGNGTTESSKVYAVARCIGLLSPLPPAPFIPDHSNDPFYQSNNNSGNPTF